MKLEESAATLGHDDTPHASDIDIDPEMYTLLTGGSPSQKLVVRTTPTTTSVVIEFRTLYYEIEKNDNPRRIKSTGRTTATFEK